MITKRNPQIIANAIRQLVLTTDNEKAICFADVVIIALKPYQVKAVLRSRSGFFKKDQIIISVVSGVMISELREWIGEHGILFRAMPNTVISIGESMTCIAGENCPSLAGSYISNLFEQLGKVVIIDEGLMDAATVLGACGTAFAMRYIRANIQGGIEIGFNAGQARAIAAQTIKGAAQMLMEKGRHPEEEIDKVTTPKGCTIAGLNEMEHHGFSSSLIKGLVSSFEQIQRY